MKIQISYIAIAVVAAFSVACSGAAAHDRGSGSTPTEFYPGLYTANGGGGALDVMDGLTKGFRERHPEVHWRMEDIGSDAGVSLAIAGDIDLGFISRDLKPVEVGQVETVPIGATGTAVAVHPSNPVTQLAKDQVRQIFAGEISDWSQVGGKPGPIKVLIREANSATRSSFESYFFGGKATYVGGALEIFEVDDTVRAVQSFDNSIAMITLDKRSLGKGGIKTVGIDGVAATRENLISGAYKIRRPLYLVYSSDPANIKPAVRAFVDFVRSADGQKILANY